MKTKKDGRASNGGVRTGAGRPKTVTKPATYQIKSDKATIEAARRNNPDLHKFMKSVLEKEAAITERTGNYWAQFAPTPEFAEYLKNTYGSEAMPPEDYEAVCRGYFKDAAALS